MSLELLSPAISGCTLTDEGETTELPVVAVSCCERGKVSYQYLKKDGGYLKKGENKKKNPFWKLFVYSVWRSFRVKVEGERHL